MEIPEPGEEGYIVRVTEENRKYLSELRRWTLPLGGRIVNYDPKLGSLLSDRLFSYKASDEGNSYITDESTEITVEQLQQILFIESLEN